MILKTNPKYLVIGLCLFLNLLLPKLSADEKGIVSSYLENARNLYTKGKKEAAKVLLQEAVELIPNYAETLFLLGSIYADSQNTTYLGLPLLEKAISLNNWTDTSPLVAQERLAYVYVQTRRYKEALQIINNLTSKYYVSAKLELAKAQALSGLNKKNEALAVLVKARHLYPRFLELYSLELKLLLEQKAYESVKKLVSLGQIEFNEEPLFILYSIKLAASFDEKLSLFDRYKKANSKDPISVIFLFEKLPAKLTEEQLQLGLNFFKANQGLDNLVLLQKLIELLRNSKYFNSLTKTIGTLNGEKIVDSDEDGFYEEKYIFQDGQLLKVFYDSNQDGLAETEIILKNNKIDGILQRPALDSTIYYGYKNFPRLSEVIYSSKEAEKKYELIPDLFIFNPIQKLAEPSTYRLRLYFNFAQKFPGQSEIFKYSNKLIEKNLKPGQPYRQWIIKNGLYFKLFEDYNYDGIFERQLFYNEKAQIVKGQADLDGDNYYEINERYENGQLISISFDENKDGKPDYLEYFKINRKEWDLNNDGIADLVETLDPSGRRIWQYSGFLK